MNHKKLNREFGDYILGMFVHKRERTETRI